MAESPPEVLAAAAQARAAEAVLAPGGDMTSPLNEYFKKHPEQMAEILETQSNGMLDSSDIIVLSIETWSIVTLPCLQRTCSRAIYNIAGVDVGCFTCTLVREFLNDPVQHADVLQQHAEKPEGSYSVVGERLNKDGKREVFYAQFHLE